MLFWVAIALADPVVVVDSDNTVRGDASVTMSVADALSQLSDPRWISEVDGSGTEIVALAPRGECGVYAHTSRTALKTITYTVTWCPTENGWRSDLVESDTFESYSAAWTVTESGEGARLQYRFAMETGMMVPQFIINRSTRKAIDNMLTTVPIAMGVP
jgi:hypothetical protein